ncbi:hypothetical protein GUJ93_ZPchr1094g7160 [Zizania palustris]|uniref:Uncharacterized protein n=1 Tax=Zizania palustris TaxID=103762 RepID=A0A8J5RCN9_ZIZPA|nr:hypothetical protein GUJ93_ZPchr1094g7160 [Zizania palustris]
MIELSSKTVNRLRNNTSVAARRSDLGDWWRGARRTVAPCSADSSAEVGARPTAAWGSDLGEAGLRPRRRGAPTSAARGSDLGGAGLRPQRRGAPTSAVRRSDLGDAMQGSDLGGAALRPRRTAARGSDLGSAKR